MGVMVRVVYEDAGKTKVFDGELLKEDDFTILVKSQIGEITIGKRALVKVMPR